MIHGLGGLVRLMRDCQPTGPRITSIEHGQLIDLIGSLQKLADELKQRDLEVKPNPEEKYDGFD